MGVADFIAGARKMAKPPTDAEIVEFRKRWLRMFPQVKLLALWIDKQLVYEHPERKSEMG